MNNDSQENTFRNRLSQQDNDVSDEAITGGFQKEGDEFNFRPLTREDFECEEDWVAYSMNQWFGHLFIDPHLD